MKIISKLQKVGSNSKYANTNNHYYALQFYTNTEFLDEDSETLERNMLTEMSEENVSGFVDKYGMNPEILLRLVTKLTDSMVEPLVDGYYDKTNDFGEVSNTKKKKKKKKKKEKPAKSKSQKKKTKPKKKKIDKRAQTNAFHTARSQQPSTPKKKKIPKRIASPSGIVHITVHFQ